MQKTRTEKEVDLLEEVEEKRTIVLYNDEVNTFEFVIESLVKICKHKTEQAEQCAYLVHFTGKCAVKQGSYIQLKPLCSALLDRGLTAEIE